MKEFISVTFLLVVIWGMRIVMHGYSTDWNFNWAEGWWAFKYISIPALIIFFVYYLIKKRED